ncbi:MAG: FHA domain-containing protein [Acidimicrobiales bacterium]
MARSVGGNLGRRRGLTPELRRACFSEMVRHVRVDREGAAPPSQYLLQLHPDDLATVDDARQWFQRGPGRRPAPGRRRHGWRLDGRIGLDCEADAGRRPGVPGALAVAPDAGGRAEPGAAPPLPRPSRTGAPALQVRRVDDGAVTVLAGGAISIGRAAERGIVIDDTRISRDHAVLAPARGGWTVADRGSANGTTVNGERLEPQQARPLAVGDVVGLGPVELVVEAAPAGPPAGTRALDDQERTRISGEVLPPPRRPRP